MNGCNAPGGGWSTHCGPDFWVLPRGTKNIAAPHVGGGTDAGAGLKTTKSGREARQLERLSRGITCDGIFYILALTESKHAGCQVIIWGVAPHLLTLRLSSRPGPTAAVRVGS